MDWRASNASDIGDIHSFALICFFLNFCWAHFFFNILWPANSCFPWIWKRILIHFSCKSSKSPSLVAQAHQKVFPIDFTHFESILQDVFWLSFISFFFMFLAKCQLSKWWFMPDSFLLIYLRIWVWRSVIICVRVIFSSLNICNILLSPLLSFWLYLSTWETRIREIAAISMNTLSILHYLPGCHIDYLYWGNNYPFFSWSSKSLLNVEHDFGFLCLLIFFLNFVITCFRNPLNVRQLEKTSSCVVSIHAKKYSCSTHQITNWKAITDFQKQVWSSEHCKLAISWQLHVKIFSILAGKKNVGGKHRWSKIKRKLQKTIKVAHGGLRSKLKYCSWT